MSRLVEALERGLLVLDGGLGVELLNELPDERRDLFGCPHATELLSLSRPELVRRKHAEFLDAGAGALTTNTFCADPASLRRIGQESRGAELVRAAVTLCRAAAGSGTLVLGSVGPGPGSVVPERDETRAYLERFVAAGCDALLIETQLEPDVLEVLVETASDVTRDTKVGLIVSLGCALDGSVPAAPDEARLASRLHDAGVELLCFNCSTGPQALRPALDRWRALWQGALGAYPNAGVPTTGEDGRLQHPIEADVFAYMTAELVRRHGLAAVGGCCGAGPAHVRALRRALTGSAS